MGGLRGTGTTDITVSASPPLPQSVTPQQITLDVPKRFSRSGSTLITQYLSQPTFSTPRILERGKLIAFTLCLDASNINAGSYVGQVVVGGPKRVEPATVAVTLNAKDSKLFLIGIIVAGLLALVLLFLRGIKVNFDKRQADAAIDANEKGAGNAAVATLKDLLGFWAPTLISIGAAVYAMITVYEGNVSWGADTVSSLVALGGTAISAAGLGTFISSLRGS